MAVSRNPKSLKISGVNVETHAADFSSPDTFQDTLQNAETIFLSLPSTIVQPAEPTIAAARAVGEAAKRTPTVKRIIFNTSCPS